MNDGYKIINGKKVWDKKPKIPFNENYKKASDKERVILLKFFSAYDITDYQLTLSESFDSYEATFTYAGDSYITETKNRNVTSTFYESGLIEEFKFNFLTAVTSASTAIPIYINFYTDGCFRLWNLKRQSVYKDLDWKNQILPVSGVDIRLGYIEKSAGYLLNNNSIYRKFN